MNEKVLLLDTSFSAKPIYDYLLNAGYEVFVLGGNNVDALAKSVSNFVHIDYSDINEVKLFIQKEGIEFLVPGGNDFSYKVCSIINEELDFFNIDSKVTNEAINNKEKFRRFAHANNLSVPQILDENEIKNNFPIIIKPVDAYSGHGISILNDYDTNEITKAIALAKSYSKSQKYIVEEFIEGQLFSHSAFLSNHKIVQDFIVEEHCKVNEYVVDTSRVIFDFDERLLKQIREEVKTISSILNLPDGLIHTQFISNGENIWLIEVTRRSPGDLYSKLIEKSTGFPYAEYYAKPFLNKKNEKKETELENNNVIRHTISTSEEKVFNLLKFKKLIDDLEIIFLSKTGDKLKKSPFSRVGIMFAKLNSKDKAEELFNDFLNKQVYEIL